MGTLSSIESVTQIGCNPQGSNRTTIVIQSQIPMWSDGSPAEHQAEGEDNKQNKQNKLDK